MTIMINKILPHGNEIEIILHIIELEDLVYIFLKNFNSYELNFIINILNFRQKYYIIFNHNGIFSES